MAGVAPLGSVSSMRIMRVLLGRVAVDGRATAPCSSRDFKRHMSPSRLVEPSPWFMKLRESIAPVVWACCENCVS